MPVAKMTKLGRDGCWALWKIEEDEETLSRQAMESCPEELTSAQKRLEYLAGRALMKSLVEDLGMKYTGMRKDAAGKPFLKDTAYQVSLSHSFPYAAAQIHRDMPVGIDVEQPKEKLLRIASRVLSERELQDVGHDPVKHCIYWCAKETMYKIYGKRGLHFNSQLLVDPFVLASAGRLSGRILADGTEVIVNLEYIVEPDFVLVTTRP
jgi:4'-phosphopantetheinyl transferase